MVGDADRRVRGRRGGRMLGAWFVASADGGAR
jgi:hypothetical protein